MSSVWLSRTLLHLIMSELADASGKSGYEVVVRASHRSGTPLARAKKSGLVEIVVEGRARAVEGATREERNGASGSLGDRWFRERVALSPGAYLRQLIKDDPVQCLAASGALLPHLHTQLCPGDATMRWCCCLCFQGKGPAMTRELCTVASMSDSGAQAQT